MPTVTQPIDAYDLQKLHIRAESLPPSLPDKRNK